MAAPRHSMRWCNLRRKIPNVAAAARQTILLIGVTATRLAFVDNNRKFKLEQFLVSSLSRHFQAPYVPIFAKHKFRLKLKRGTTENTFAQKAEISLSNGVTARAMAAMMNCSAFGSVSLVSSQHISSPLWIRWIPDERAPYVCLSIYLWMFTFNSIIPTHFSTPTRNFFSFCHKFVSCVPFSAKCERMLCADHAFRKRQKKPRDIRWLFWEGVEVNLRDRQELRETFKWLIRVREKLRR